MGGAPCRGGGDVDDGAWTNIPSSVHRRCEQFFGEAGRNAVFSHRTEQSIPVVCRTGAPGTGSTQRDRRSLHSLECGPDNHGHA